PRWRTPFSRRFFGREVFSAPLPSGGGAVLLMALGLLDGYRSAPGSLERFDLLARVFRAAFVQHADFAGDPDALSEAESAQLSQLITGTSHADLARLSQRTSP